MSKQEKSISQNRDFKGIWFPASLYLNTELTWNEKVVMLEINSLCKHGKSCFRTNTYWSKFLGVSERTVTNILSNLANNGYIERNYTYVKDSKQIENRYLSLTPKAIKLIDDIPDYIIKALYEHSNCDTPLTQISIPSSQKNEYPPHSNCEDNNTIYNNTLNNNTDSNDTNNIDLLNIFNTNEYKESKGLYMLNKGNFSEEKSVTPTADIMEMKPILIPKNAPLVDKVTAICNRYTSVNNINVVGYVDTIVEIINYYYEIYQKISPEHSTHPILTTDRLIQVVHRLLKYRLYLDTKIMKPVIDQHFMTEYQNCDYNILHFVSGDIILHRIQETFDDYSYEG